ncbi:MAG: 4-alpha-glucanotransferase, partial [Moraxellaceae bacterium]
EVYALRDEFKLPGMKVLQFAFGEDMAQSIHIPHNYPVNCYAYTGTHDNNTLVGWFENEADAQNIKRVKQYTGKKISAENINWTLIELAYASVAQTVMMPMQDILGEDEKARMNTPASTEQNWSWRMLPGNLNKQLQKKLKKMALFYNRA